MDFFEKFMYIVFVILCVLTVLGIVGEILALTNGNPVNITTWKCLGITTGMW